MFIVSVCVNGKRHLPYTSPVFETVQQADGYRTYLITTLGFHDWKLEAAGDGECVEGVLRTKHLVGEGRYSGQCVDLRITPEQERTMPHEQLAAMICKAC